MLFKTRNKKSRNLKKNLKVYRSPPDRISGERRKDMTKFENDTLITLLAMKAKELKENPPKNLNQDAVKETASDVEKIYHNLIAIDAMAEY